MADLNYVEWIYVTGSLFAAWVLLSIVGRERQRRIDEIQLLSQVNAARKASQEAPKTPMITTVSAAK